MNCWYIGLIYRDYTFTLNNLCMFLQIFYSLLVFFFCSLSVYLLSCVIMYCDFVVRFWAKKYGRIRWPQKSALVISVLSLGCMCVCVYVYMNICVCAYAFCLLLHHYVSFSSKNWVTVDSCTTSILSCIVPGYELRCYRCFCISRWSPLWVSQWILILWLIRRRV